MSCKRTGRRPPTKLRLGIDSLAFGGDGVGRAEDGRVVFVPATAPGDEVELIVLEEKKGYVRGELARLLRPGTTRVEPPCPHFAQGCGGCQWQHVSIAAQRAAKTDVVRRALRKVVADVRPLEIPAPDYGWRRRARLRWRRGVLGYTKQRSHELVDVKACPQLEPALDAAYRVVREALAGHLDGSGEVELLLGGRGDVHVVLSGRSAAGFEAAARGLVGRAGIVGVVLDGGEGAARQIVGAPLVDLADDGDVPFSLTADAFAQASASGNTTLRRLVLEAAGPLAGARVLELHAGSANFTRDLAAQARQVVAVEEFAPAAALAAQNLAARRLSERVVWRAEAAEPAVARLATAGERFDVIVVDPPRTGLEPGLPARLAALAPARLVYVSCDPNTLARDLAALVAGGLEVRWAVPVDLMPQTFHVETVVCLHLGGSVPLPLDGQSPSSLPRATAGLPAGPRRARPND